jgi:hypothetical protein
MIKECAQIGFLHDVVGLNLIAHNPKRHIEGGIYVRQCQSLESGQLAHGSIALSLFCERWQPHPAAWVGGPSATHGVGRVAATQIRAALLTYPLDHSVHGSDPLVAGGTGKLASNVLLNHLDFVQRAARRA